MNRQNLIFESICSPGKFFNNHFNAARTLFLDSVNCLDSRQFVAPELISFDHPLQGPLDEHLATDIVWIGDKNALNVVVFISATHGIEGYAGSAIQSFLLKSFCQDELSIPQGTAFLFIHALNPWGMAWHRRCDEQGIDLNRNFIDFNSTPPIHPDYDRVQSWLFEADQTKRQAAFDRIKQEIGRRRFQEAISSGQYVNSKAPYFGGQQVSFGRQSTEKIIDLFKLEGKDIIVIDLHTGLGPWAHGELISDHPLESSQEQYAVNLFNQAVSVPERGTSFSVPLHGLLDYAWHSIMSEKSCYLTLEFGTYSTQALFDVLVSDHLSWSAIESTSSDHDLMAAASIHKHSKTGMLTHFCPDSLYWQQAVLFRAWQIMNLILIHRREHR